MLSISAIALFPVFGLGAPEMLTCPILSGQCDTISSIDDPNRVAQVTGQVRSALKEDKAAGRLADKQPYDEVSAIYETVKKLREDCQGGAGCARLSKLTGIPFGLLGMSKEEA
ncbi:MAG: hypothetical protein A3J74_05035 [Elusimicrobia bacterium RIFCSPHIGHO2_02_FULL_57_9]|nr:MAG: hypothetical protein A3J74_05035 [Elusimicrobia bacterium RIFCSPHIGHO2_02_FULL_57_9]